uniref:Fibronectin type-III domain-containing protein n=1 Tax=Canis lupus familiaris TaxID=9615 RepID=A0A8C0T8R7_CANLF
MTLTFDQPIPTLRNCPYLARWEPLILTPSLSPGHIMPLPGLYRTRLQPCPYFTQTGCIARPLPKLILCCPHRGQDHGVSDQPKSCPGSTPAFAHASLPAFQPLHPHPLRTLEAVAGALAGFPAQPAVGGPAGVRIRTFFNPDNKSSRRLCSVCAPSLGEEAEGGAPVPAELGGAPGRAPPRPRPPPARPPGTFRRGEGAGPGAQGAEAAGRGGALPVAARGRSEAGGAAARGRAGPGGTGGAAGAPCGRPGRLPPGRGRRRCGCCLCCLCCRCCCCATGPGPRPWATAVLWSWTLGRPELLVGSSRGPGSPLHAAPPEPEVLEPEVKSIPLTPIEIQDLELATGYEVFGRCRMEKEEDLWSDWSPILSLQTLPSAPKDVWISGNPCSPGRQEWLLLWKDRGHCMQMNYKVWFQVKDQELIQKTAPCCNLFIPTQAEWVGVSAVNATSWEPLTNLSLACLGPDFAPHDVVVSSIPGRTELLVTWQRGPGELQEHVVDWARDGDPLENLSWVRLPPENLSVLLPGNFEEGVPYRITVTAVSPWGLAPAPSVWRFREELTPLAGPVLWRLQDAPPGTPAIAWGEVPRHQLRGHLTHYTLCAQSGTRPSVCVNVSGSTQNITLPDLQWGPCELWVTASTIAGQGPPGPSLRLHLPDNTLKWKVLPGVLLLWGLFLMVCVMSLATSGRCVHLRHKVLPRWVWEKIPDPANSNFGQPHLEEVVPPAQTPGDFPILKVEDMEPLQVIEPPQASTQLDSGYEKHFLPTPEELGLLGPPPGPKFWPEPTPSQERGAHLTDEDTEAQRG